jgi:SAM-dependent methyltransferase
MDDLNFRLLAQSKVALDAVDMERLAEICRLVPGYSDARHYLFFKRLFASTTVANILMLGVYFGRDIVLMLEAARRAGRKLRIMGVDKFSDDACADWPASLRGRGWEEAGFGRAPSLEEAAACIEPYQGGAEVTLVREPDERFLNSCTETFDLIYLDTAHDHATVQRQLRQAVRLLAAGGLLAGDDYSDQGTWGVRRALGEAAPGHAVFAEWLWFAARGHVKAAAPAFTAP